MSDKFSFYQTEGLWGIIENASDEKQTSIKSYFGSDLLIKRLNEQADQIDQLKQQLAEKEKENEEMDLNGNSYCEIRQGTSPHNPTDYAWFNYVKFRNYLNQQIKELKGEKDIED